MPSTTDGLTWVVLTMGDRPGQLDAALASLGDDTVVLVGNGTDRLPTVRHGTTVPLDSNLGVPGGRHAGLRRCHSEVVAFLDDDAVAAPEASDRIVQAFRRASDLAVVSFGVVDEDGRIDPVHVPRPGERGLHRSGEVSYFLGGACAIRRTAYEEVGGYFTGLVYGHEEVELSWRLIEAGWRIEYRPDIEVFHPRSTIGRHADGWRHTGRNRVLIARRTLPWPVAFVHVIVWLVLGALRAARESAGRAYLRGWLSGWRGPVDRAPISWRGVWRLARLGRPPLI
ncbi:MAG: glycosyltransferase [Actinomycetota bacterium]